MEVLLNLQGTAAWCWISGNGVYPGITRSQVGLPIILSHWLLTIPTSDTAWHSPIATWILLQSKTWKRLLQKRKPFITLHLIYLVSLSTYHQEPFGICQNICSSSRFKGSFVKGSGFNVGEPRPRHPPLQHASWSLAHRCSGSRPAKLVKLRAPVAEEAWLLSVDWHLWQVVSFEEDQRLSRGLNPGLFLVKWLTAARRPPKLASLSARSHQVKLNCRQNSGMNVVIVAYSVD